MSNDLMQDLMEELKPNESPVKESEAVETKETVTEKEKPTIYENVFQVKGKIVGFGYDRMAHNSMTVIVRKQTPLFVHISYNENLVKEELKVGDNVDISGIIKAFSYNDLSNKRTHVQYFEAKSIEKRKTIMEQKFGCKGRFYHEDDFVAYLAGEVLRVFNNNDTWGQLILKVDGAYGGKRSTYVRVSYYKKGRLPKFDYNPGDNVCLYASVWTPKKEVDGHTVFYENLMTEDIDCVKRVPKPELKTESEAELEAAELQEPDTEIHTDVPETEEAKIPEPEPEAKETE